MFTIPTELFTAFNEITYYDEPHKYFMGDIEFVSVTTLLHKFQEKFEEDYWANYKANQFGITSDDVKKAWRFINKKGTLKGSLIHNYAENLFQNKVFPYPEKEIFNEFGFDPIYKEYEITKKHADKFYNDTFGKLILIKAETIVYDFKSLVAGMFDIVFYNVKAGEFQIWDYKTNKKLTLENKNKKLLGEMSSLDDCDLEIYSLQLSTYKRIIERNTGIKLGKSYLVWLSHNNESYRIIETKDRTKEAESILINRENEIKQKYFN